MKIAELPYLAWRRLTNQARGLALHHGFTTTRRFDARVLFTTMQGIYFYDRGRVRRIAPNQHFGIARLSDQAFVSAEWLSKSPIEKSAVFIYRFDGKTVLEKTEIAFRDAHGNRLQPYGVHQVRVLNGYLWVVNTRENVVWQCRLDGEVLREWTETDKMPFDERDPRRAVAQRKSSFDYRHYNSIGWHGGRYYILAHNCTHDHDNLSRRSYIVILDEALNVVERIDDAGRASHDLVFLGDDLHVCSSREGTVLRNQVPVLRIDAFLRGMDYHDGLMVIGGSQFEVKNSARESTPSRLFFVDPHQPALLAALTLGRVGNIRDVLFWT